jgi:Tol biopolymer transport system component
MARRVIGGRARLALPVLMVLVVFAGGGSIAGTSAQSPAVLVFASNRAADVNSEVYSIDLAGGARRDISRDDAHSDQVVALHGGQVVFKSDRSGVALYGAAVGSNGPVRRIVGLPSTTNDVSVSWSPNGAVLAVALVLYGKRSVSSRIRLVDPSGRELAELRDATPSRGASSLWSADGARLAYALGPPGEQRHVIRIADARGRLRLSRRGDQALWAQAAPRLAIMSGTFSNNPASEGSTAVYDEQGRAIRRFAGQAVAFSPDGKLLVLDRRRRGQWLASVGTGKLRRLPGGAVTDSFSPDSAHLELTGADSKAVLVSVPSGRVEAHLPGLGMWLADSRRLAYVGPGQAATIETIGGRVLRRLPVLLPGEYAATFAVAQNGKTLVYTAQSELPHQLYEQRASGVLRQITHGGTDHLYPAPSPDGRLIADAEFDTPCGNCFPPEIGVLPADGSAPARILPNQVMGNSHPSWSPDGTRIAYGENAPDILGIFVMQADGSQPEKLSGGAGGTEPSWAPDGSAIAATRNGIFVMASDGTGAQQLTGPVPAGSAAEQTHAPAWSPDSTALAFAGADGLYLIGRDGGGLHRILALRRIASVAWSPDGALIAFAAPCQSDTVDCTNHLAGDIWTVRPDGSGLRRVTDNVADDATPAWLAAPAP